MTTSARLQLALFLIFLGQGIPCRAQKIVNYYPSEFGGGPNIYSIAKDPLGLLYFANNKGIQVYNGSSWRLIELPHYGEGRTVMADEDGLIYASGFGQFGYLGEDQWGNTTYYSISDSLDSQVPLGDVWQIIFNLGVVHFQTYDQIFSWNPANHNLTSLPLQNAYIFSGFGKLFASQFGTGLGLFENGTFQLLGPLGIDEAAFQFFSISENKIVVPTSSSGFFLLTQTASGEYSFQRMKTPIDSLIVQLGFYDGVRLKENLFALGTWEGGIIFYDFDTQWQKQISKNDGLISDHINALVLGPLGDLWVGTDMGISVLTLDSLMAFPPPSVQSMISRIVVNRDSILFSGNDSNPFHNTENKPLISGKENSILISFTTPGLSSKSQNQYKYFLKGYDEDWSEWTSRTEKEYIHLNEGHYTFQAKSMLPDGTESTPARLDFNIQYAWYQSVWANLGLFLLAALAIGFGVKRYTGRLARSKSVLEKAVRIKTNELSSQKTELKKANEDLTRINNELDQFVYRSSHDLVAPIKSLKGLVDLARIDQSSQSFEKYLVMIKEQILKLEEFISYLLNYSANSKQEIEYQLIDFEQIISKSRDKLRFYENAAKIHIETHITENGGFKSDSRRLGFILDNLLSNAIKYHRLDQPNPRIRIEVKHQDDGVDISFIDNGMGIEPDHQGRIFDMFYRASNIADGSGLGLYIAREAARKLNGDIFVISEPSKGSTFVVKIPNAKIEQS